MTSDLSQEPARPNLLNEEEAADFLTVKAPTLKAWRSTDRVAGPTYVRIGRAVRYRLSDLEAFVQAGANKA